VEYCQKLGSKATKVSEIISSKDKAIYAAIQKGISAVNEGAVSNAQKVQKWVLLEKDFSLFGGELGEWWVGQVGLPPPQMLNRQRSQDPNTQSYPWPCLTVAFPHHFGEGGMNSHSCLAEPSLPPGFLHSSTTSCLAAVPAPFKPSAVLFPQAQR